MSTSERASLLPFFSLSLSLVFSVCARLMKNRMKLNPLFVRSFAHSSSSFYLNRSAFRKKTFEQGHYIRLDSLSHLSSPPFNNNHHHHGLTTAHQTRQMNLRMHISPFNSPKATNEKKKLIIIILIIDRRHTHTDQYVLGDYVYFS